MMGTPAFMAPEQAMARTEDVDAQSDVWAVGATLFTLLSGSLVHDGDNSTQLLIRAATAPAPPMASAAPDVAPALANVIDRALAFDKAARWPSAAAMREALREASLSMFGEGPSRRVLRGLLGLDDRAPQSTERPPAPSVVRTPPAELTTSQPVETEPQLPASPPRARAGIIAVLACGVTVLVIGLTAVAVRALGHRPVVAAPAQSSEAAPAPTPAAAPAETLAPAEPLPSVQGASSTVAAPPDHPGPVASTAPAARVPAVRPTPTPKAASAKSDCAVPYVLDSSGNKKWKLQCLGH
jgi:serine/threonine-protein kinase